MNAIDTKLTAAPGMRLVNPSTFSCSARKAATLYSTAISSTSTARPALDAPQAADRRDGAVPVQHARDRARLAEARRRQTSGPSDRVLDRRLRAAAARDQLDDLEERDWPLNRRGKREDPWKKTTYLPMRCMEDDENVVFGPFADTQRKAIRSFVGVYRRSDRDGKDPVVLLENRSFENQSGGTTYVPTFKIVDWAVLGRRTGTGSAAGCGADHTSGHAGHGQAGRTCRRDSSDDMDDEIPF